jgi:hypothetical protein
MTVVSSSTTPGLCDSSMNLDAALTTAINVLRDVAESRRMPSGVAIGAEVAALHENAATRLELLRTNLKGDKQDTP